MRSVSVISATWLIFILTFLELLRLGSSYNVISTTDYQQHKSLALLAKKHKQILHSSTEPTFSSKRTLKKINNKQFDVINLLWKKVKIFEDVDNITVNNKFDTEETSWGIRNVNPSKSFLNAPMTLRNKINEQNIPIDKRVRQLETFSISRMLPLDYPLTYPGRKNLRQDSLLNVNKPAQQCHPDSQMKLRPFLSRKRLSKIFPIQSLGTLTTTSSSIEFDYYLHKTDNSKLAKRQQQSSENANAQHIGSKMMITPNLPRFYIKAEGRIPSYNIKYEANMKRSAPRPISVSKTEIILQENSSTTLQVPTTTQKITNYGIDQKEVYNKNNHNTKFSATKISTNKHILDSNETTTISDKIKFFEMYDKQSEFHDESYDESPLFHDKYNSSSYENYFSDQPNTKILLKHVDIDTSHNKNINISHARIDKREYKEESSIKNTTNLFTNKNIIQTEEKPNFESTIKQTEQIQTTQYKLTSYSMSLVKIPPTISKRALWSEYPFTAVYIHDPTQVHCDAAAISPRWLVAAAACLYRHSLEDHPGDFRTAFVSYCSASWRQPRSIVYVKNVIIHPEFLPNDEKRKHMYNIGVIRVINAMSLTCAHWSAASLMSHQFMAEPGGTPAVAVGWGLDRYGTRYSSLDLPRWPLMKYESFIYSNSCPGSNEFKRQYDMEDHGGVGDLFCMLLPPYSKEEEDPVHGSLLVIGGKLIALYLKEERRGRGEQSAQYTSVWRLVPWILEVARENNDEEMDGLSVDSL